MDIYGKSGTILMPKPARCLNILHPATAFIYLIMLMAIIFMFNHPAFIVSAFIFAVIQASYFTAFKSVISRLKFYFVFGTIIALITPIFNRRGRHVLFFLNERPFTLEALTYGFYIMFLLLSILTVFITFNSVVSPSKFLYLFSKAAPQTAFIINMTLRFGAVLKSKATDYLNVQKSRECGADANLVKQGVLLTSFALWSLEDGLAVSETLKAKAYGKYKRTHYNLYAFTFDDIVYISVITAVFLLLVILQFLSKPYSYFRTLTDLSLDIYGIAAYVCIVSFALLPFAADIFQVIRRSLSN